MSGGSVAFQAGSLALSTGGQIALSASGRVLAGSGATLSVAGSVDTILPAAANSLQIASVQGYDLRDAPANRDTGVLTSQTVNIALGRLVQIGDLQYTNGGLLEVSGYLAGVEHSIGEWSSVGGSIALKASEVVAQPGALFNIAGGLITYAAGSTPNTWLTGSDGKLYNINTAPANLTYTGIYDGFTVNQPRWGITQTFNSPLIAPATTYSSSYTVGRDGGTLTINAPTTVMEATIDASVSTGELQNGARPANVGDPFTLAQTVVPLPGSLVIGPVALPSVTPVITSTDVTITAADQPLAASLGLTAPIPPDRVDTTTIAASVLNDAALGGLTIVTQGAIHVDAPVTLADGGIVALLAPSVEVSGSVTARGGQVTAGNFSPSYFVQDVGNFRDAKDSSGTPLLAAFVLGNGATIDTSGVFSNLTMAPLTTSGEAFINGGPVTIDTSGAGDPGRRFDDRCVGGRGRAGEWGDQGWGRGRGIDHRVRSGRHRRGGTVCRGHHRCRTARIRLRQPALHHLHRRCADPDGTGGGDRRRSRSGIDGRAGAGLLRGRFLQLRHHRAERRDGCARNPDRRDPADRAIHERDRRGPWRHGACRGVHRWPAAALHAQFRHGGDGAAARRQHRAAGWHAQYRHRRDHRGGRCVHHGRSRPDDRPGDHGPGSPRPGVEGQITIDGALIAPSGSINVVNDQFAGTSNSLSIWIGGG